MMAEKIQFFVFTGSKTFVSDWQTVGNLLTYMQSTETILAGIYTCMDVTNWLLFDQRCCSDYEAFLVLGVILLSK